MILIAMSFSVVLADLVSVVSILGMGLFGFRYGLFLATVVGLLVLSGFLGAVALAPVGARWLESMDCPVGYSLPASYFLILAAVLGAGRLLVGTFVEEDDVRLSPLVDQILGVAVGLMSGALVGGAIFVGWSMCDLPRVLQLYPQSMRFDTGSRALWTFVRCVEADRHERERMYQGDVWRQPADALATGPVLRASEPFDDADGDWMHDESERYLDYDRSGSFTRDQLVFDHSGGVSGRRDIGVIDSYWLSSWRHPRVMHAPRITSSRNAAVAADEVADGVIYIAVAEDPDAGDELKYSLKQNEDDEARLLTIGPQNGVVRLRGSELDPAIQNLRFCVVVSDRSGIAAEQEVNVAVEPRRKK
jgi:hypothetical protein